MKNLFIVIILFSVFTIGLSKLSYKNGNYEGYIKGCSDVIIVLLNKAGASYNLSEVTKFCEQKNKDSK